MPDLAIDIDHVSKEFVIDGLGDYQRATEAFAIWVRKKLRGQDDPSHSVATSTKHGRATVGPQRFLALDDINLQVACGETLGIVGSNGAGKSTLLKILSRIMTPTKGRVGVRGRVGCLLEVGTGFHPELTGRENVFLNGAILGMPRREIRKRFDEIVEFAEVGKFLDMPVKRYSNGMLIRLGFSVAAHLDPDVLIVDEVLGVGDAAFQRKSLGKARDFREQGRTVLMVSHNLPMIASFCSRAVLIRDGKLISDGTPDSIIEQHLSATADTSSIAQWNSQEQNIGTEYLQLENVLCRSVGTGRETALTLDAPVAIEITYRVTQPGHRVCLQLVLTDESGTQILRSINAPGSNAVADEAYDQILEPGQYVCTCTIPANLLNNRRYVIGLAIGEEPNRVDRVLDSLLGFEVHDASPGAAATNIIWDAYAVRPRLTWQTRRQA